MHDVKPQQRAGDVGDYQLGVAERDDVVAAQIAWRNERPAVKSDEGFLHWLPDPHALAAFDLQLRTLGCSGHHNVRADSAD